MKVKTILFLVLILIGCSKVTLYDYEKREQITTDSLSVLDSLKIADSIQTYDSLLAYHYLTADETREELKKRKTARLTAIEKYKEDSIVAAADTTTKEKPSGPTLIVIKEDTKYAEMIDSLQTEIDNLTDSIYGEDPLLLEMKDLKFLEKKAHLKYLLREHKKDTAEVLAFCESMQQLYNLEYEKHVCIMETQKGDTRGLINLHIRKIRAELGELGRFIYSLTSKMPPKIKYKTRKKSIWERDK